MARIKGPNGLVLEVPDAIAKGLVEEGRTGSYSYVKDESKSAPKTTAKRSSSKK